MLAGIFLNMCVCGMLFRDLEYLPKSKSKRKKRNKKRNKNKKKRRKSNGGGSLRSGRSSGSAMPSVEDLRAILEGGDICSQLAREELCECPRLSSSLVDLPTYLNSGERLPDELVNALAGDREACRAILRGYQAGIEPRVSQDRTGLLSADNMAVEVGDKGTAPHATPEDDEPAGVKLKRKVSSLFARPSKSILKNPEDVAATDAVGSSEEDHLHHPSAVPEEHQSQHFHRTTMNMYHLRMRRQSLTYRRAMLSTNRYRLRASSCPDIYRNSMSTIAQEEDYEDGVSRCCCLCLKGFLQDLCR